MKKTQRSLAIIALVITALSLIFSGCVEQATLPSPTPTPTLTPSPTPTLTPTATPTPTPTSTPTSTPKPPESPIFELKELRTGVSTPDNTSAKVFYFTYSTNQDSIQMEITAPDGSSIGPFSLSGPGEKKGWARIPPKDSEARLSYPGFVALPGTYKFTVYVGETKIWEKDFMFEGAKLLIENASVTKWKWQWSWPVSLTYTDEIAITVSNKGDLPSRAIAILTIDRTGMDKNVDQDVESLGYIAPGETRTIALGKTQVAFVIKRNFKQVGDLIPPSTHTLSVRLISDIWSKSFQYPYPITTYKTEYYEDRVLLLHDYSTTVQTPSVQTG